MVLELVGGVWMFLMKTFPAIVKTKTFSAGAFVWALGVVLWSIGFACAKNAIIDMRECPRTGRWNPAVKGMFWGGWFFAIGLFLMFLVIFAYQRRKLRVRIAELKFNPLFILGMLLLSGGLLFGSIGGACLDGEHMHCQESTWTGLLSVGPSMFMLGFVVVYLLCEWGLPVKEPKSLREKREKLKKMSDACMPTLIMLAEEIQLMSEIGGVEELIAWEAIQTPLPTELGPEADNFFAGFSPRVGPQQMLNVAARDKMSQDQSDFLEQLEGRLGSDRKKLKRKLGYLLLKKIQHDKEHNAFHEKGGDVYLQQLRDEILLAETRLTAPKKSAREVGVVEQSSVLQQSHWQPEPELEPEPDVDPEEEAEPKLAEDTPEGTSKLSEDNASEAFCDKLPTSLTKLSLYLGLLCIFVALPMISTGAGDLNKDIANSRAHRLGVIFTVNGSTFLFVGVLFVGMSFTARKLLYAWLTIALECFGFGAVMVTVGILCVDDDIPECTKGDGYVLVLVGSCMLFLSGFPSLCIYLSKFFSDTVRKPSFVTGFSLVTAGVIVTSFGIACGKNRILGVEECGRAGKWSTTVTLLFWGLFSVCFGIFAMSVAVFESFYDRRWKRIREIKGQPSFVVACFLLASGAVAVGFGSACVDDTLVGVDDCQSTGTFLLSLGIPMCMFGFFLFVFAYVWTWQDPGENIGNLAGPGGSKAVMTTPTTAVTAVLPPIPPPRVHQSAPPTAPPRPQPDGTSPGQRPSQQLPSVPAAVVQYDGIKDLATLLRQPTLYFAAVFILCGLLLIPIGSSCLHVDPAILEEARCPHQRGVICTIAGSAALFVGGLFVGLTITRDSMVMAYILSAEILVSGVVILSAGSLCMANSVPGVQSCIELDGAIMCFVGVPLALASPVPVIWLHLRRKYPKVVAQEQFGGGIVLVIASLVVLSFGVACAENNIYGIEECDRRGKWNDAVTTIALATMGFLVGCFVVSTAFYPNQVALFLELCREVPALGLGLVIAAFGLVSGTVGVFCVDDYLPLVKQCPASFGDVLAVAGVLIFLTGTLLSHTVWRYARTEKAWFIFHTHVLAVYLLVSGVLLGAAGTCCLMDKFPGSQGCQSVGNYLIPIGWYIVLLACTLTARNVVLNRPDTFRLSPQFRSVAEAYLRSGGPTFFLCFTVGVVMFSVGVACMQDTLVGQPGCSETTGAIFTALGAVLFNVAVVARVMRYCHKRGRRMIDTKIGIARAAEWQVYTPTSWIPKSGINIWAEARVGSTVFGKLYMGDEVSGVLLEDWLRVEYPEDSGQQAWVLAQKSRSVVYMRLVPGAVPRPQPMTAEEKQALEQRVAAEVVSLNRELGAMQLELAAEVESKAVLVPQLDRLRDVTALHGGLGKSSHSERAALQQVSPSTWLESIIRGCPMPLEGLECRVSKSTDRDACPAPRGAGGRPPAGAARAAHGPGPPGAFTRPRCSHRKIGFGWRVCMGAPVASRPLSAARAGARGAARGAEPGGRAQARRGARGGGRAGGAGGAAPRAAGGAGVIRLSRFSTRIPTGSGGL
jgi:hypothetical protein